MCQMGESQVPDRAKEDRMWPQPTFLTAAKLTALRQEEVLRDFQEIRLLEAARISNPGWTEKLWLLLGHWLIRTGHALRDQYTVERQTYLDSATRYAA
jgi:hypothetical protein